MVSKDVSFLGFLLPIATIIGTSLAIYFYKHSSSNFLIMFALGGIYFGCYVFVLKNHHHRMI